jgi:hypothetical protein
MSNAVGAGILARNGQAQRVAVDCQHGMICRQRQRIAADATGEVGHYPEWRIASCAVVRDHLAGRLLQTIAREIHLGGTGELAARAGTASQRRLLERGGGERHRETPAQARQCRQVGRARTQQRLGCRERGLPGLRQQRPEGCQVQTYSQWSPVRSPGKYRPPDARAKASPAGSSDR